ncbi:hypothetical protein [Branchiibius cervicis]|uniref:Endonuclease n=1 Tax=Branchiibius cervicis TaxID=908252 RepID=A0ABW2ANX7_9MICO
MAYRITPDGLLDTYGTTYAQEAGITLRDKPAPLYQLLVLTMLSSIRISADTAARAASELFRAGWRTPTHLLESTWQERVDALGRGGYRRYDESTADYLAQQAEQVRDRLHGDLRRLTPDDRGGVPALRKALQEFPGSGRPGRPSSAGRCRRSGPRCGRSSTLAPGVRPRSWAIRATRTSWRTW